MSKNYKLIPITDLDKATQLQVLKIRNEEYIREWMFTKSIITEDEHFSWIECLKNEQSQLCFIIIDDNSQPFGAVNIKNIDKINKNAELGFYKTQSLTEKGLMTNCLIATLNYSFDVLELKKIYGEVFENNIKSVQLFNRLFFVEEGFLRSHIINKKVRIGVHLYGLLKSEWEITKGRIGLKNEITICR
jgi:UDP-4-amino-4,6-dideoxy-N-acetyl-beta-L-altrosamine N-acetyltransferase